MITMVAWMFTAVADRSDLGVEMPAADCALQAVQLLGRGAST